MRLFRRIVLRCEGSECEAVFPFVWSDGVLGMHLCSPSIVTAYAHLLVVDVEPYHIFLLDASTVAALHLRGTVFNVLHREVPGAYAQRFLAHYQQAFAGCIT